jgi:hypothetical protein
MACIQREKEKLLSHNMHPQLAFTGKKRKKKKKKNFIPCIYMLACIQKKKKNTLSHNMHPRLAFIGNRKKIISQHASTCQHAFIKIFPKSCTHVLHYTITHFKKYIKTIKMPHQLHFRIIRIIPLHVFIHQYAPTSKKYIYIQKKKKNKKNKKTKNKNNNKIIIFSVHTSIPCQQHFFKKYIYKHSLFCMQFTYIGIKQKIFNFPKHSCAHLKCTCACA